MFSRPAGVVPKPSIARPQPPAQGRQGNFETRLGTAILSKVAVVLLLLGAAWFLKWAFDNRWIGPTGRVAAGLAAGVGVNLWAERFRRQQLAGFSYALKAVGSGVLYLSLWASVQLYHLVPALAGFAAMAAVTAWNAVTAQQGGSQLLAGYALLGAYLTPLLLRTGGDHEIFLFSYLLVLASMLLGWLRVRPWSLLLLGGQAATTAVFIAWYTGFFQADRAALTIGFAVALWAVFAAAPLVAVEMRSAAAEASVKRLRERTGASPAATLPTGLIPAGVAAPVANGVLVALAIYSVLADSGGYGWEPWWAMGFAAAYLALAFLRRKPGILSAAHLGLAVAFFTAMIPLKTSGHPILLSWAAEAVALIAISAWKDLNHSARAALRALGAAVLLLAVCGVLLQPLLFGNADHELLNADFLTALSTVAALVVALPLLAVDSGSLSGSGPGLLSGAWLAAVFLVLLNVVLLVAMHRELDLWTAARSGHPTGNAEVSRGFLFSAWMMLQGALMLAGGFWRKVALARWTGLVLLGGTLFKLAALDMRSLGTGYRVVSYLGLGVLLMAVSFAYQKDWLGLLALNGDPPGDHPPLQRPESQTKPHEAQV